jgi:hypothetical protein
MHRLWHIGNCSLGGIRSLGDGSSGSGSVANYAADIHQRRGALLGQQPVGLAQCRLEKGKIKARFAGEKSGEE